MMSSTTPTLCTGVEGIANELCVCFCAGARVWCGVCMCGVCICGVCMSGVCMCGVCM